MKASKRMTAGFLAILFALSLSLIPSAVAAGDTVYVSSTGSDAGDGSAGSPFATVQAAYDAIATAGSIRVIGDLSLEEKITFGESKTITIIGDGATLTYTSSVPVSNGADGMISVFGGSVTFEDITVQMPETKGTPGRVLYIGGGDVTLGNGAVFAHGYLAYSGGGILVDGGTLTMLEGASVRDCYIANNTSAYGGGVYVRRGTFTMLGGSVSGNRIHTTQNYQSFGGGVAVGPDGTLELLGGSITGNAADTAGGGVYASGSLTLAGNATVTGNTPGNLYLPSTDVRFSVIGELAGSIGLTHGAPDYGIVVGVPGGYTISDDDADIIAYDGGAYDIRLRDGNLVLDFFTVGAIFSGTNLTGSNTEAETPLGADYDTVLSAPPGYVLPSSIAVTVSGSALDESLYSYDSASGVLHIPGQYVTGDIVITAEGNPLHTITVTATNAAVDVVTPITVVRQDTTVITVSAAPRYARPNSVGISGGCSHTYVDGILTITNVTGDVAVTVDGAEIPHTIYFDPGAGTVDVTAKVISESEPALGTLPVPARTGYTFSGWFTAGGVMVTAETENTMTDDLHLTARWTANTNIVYTVNHYLEYVDSGLNPGFASGDDLHYMSYGGVTKVYYLYTTTSYDDGVADGRRTIANLLLHQFAVLSADGFTPNGATEYSVTISPDGTSLFPFYYDRNTYQVNFDPNHGAMNVADQTMNIIYGSLYGHLPAATRAGYSLIGWFPSPTGGAQVQNTDQYLAAENQTLYAHWQPEGTVQYQVVHMIQTLRGNLVSYDKNPDNYSAYATDTLTGTAATTVDVYAIDIHGFEESPANVYTLSILPDGTSVRHLYYDRIATDVSYDSNGGSVVAMGSRIYYGGIFASLPAAPSRVGYTFTGWYTGTGTEAQLVTPGTEINSINPAVRRTLILYAKWTANTYDLVFTTHGGTLSNTKSVTYDKPVGALPTASLKGYVFKNWYLEDTLPGKPDSEPVTANTMVTADTLIDIIPGGTETVRPLYAWYTPMEITITFDPNGGTMEDSTCTAVYDAVYGALPVPTRAGYTFLGWHLEGGTLLESAHRSDLLTDATATAQWSPNVYKVTLDVQGGAPLTPGYIAATYDCVYGDLPVPSRANHSFSGWFTAEGIEITADTQVTITAPQTLYARWATTGGGGGGSITASTSPPIHVCPSLEYDDLDPSEWYHDATDFVISTGFMTGTTPTSFSPHMVLTRAQVAEILARIAKVELHPPQTAVFDDVALDHWAAAAIEWAVEAELMLGYGNGSFGPNDPLTREQVTLILYRMDRAPESTESLACFTDSGAVSEWALGAMRWAVSSSLIVGDEQSRLCPQDSITRVEAAVILLRWLSTNYR